MRYRQLGPTGTTVSAFALGTMTFGMEADEAEAFAMLDAFVDAGGTLVDTADVYSAGASEEIVGRWLAGSARSDDVVVATKGRFPLGRGAPEGLDRRYLARALDASLTRLGVERIDLYQTHCWDPLTPVEETLRFLDDAVRAGKIHHVGVSNVTGWQLQRLVLTARHAGLAPVVTLQPHYNLLGREIEWELVPLCVDEGVGILPWSPLGGGWLTGKYRREDRPTGATRLGENPNRGVEDYDKRDTEHTWTVLDAVREVADGRGVSMAEVALAWVTDRPAVSSTILGARDRQQLAANLAAADLVLAPEETARLDAASALPLPVYPYGLLEQMTARRRPS